MQSECRIHGLARVLHTSEYLRGLRFGATTAEIREAVCERVGRWWCERSFYRDLDLLESLGFVLRRKRRGACTLWVWRREAGPLVEMPVERLEAPIAAC